ncbi:MAG: hypothetical protein ACYSYM_14745 [Planctomycetota bacterium]
MDRKIMTKAVFALSLAAGACLAWEHPKSCDVHQKDPKVDAVLEQLNKKTGELKSYQCRIEYEYIQPHKLQHAQTGGRKGAEER